MQPSREHSRRHCLPLNFLRMPLLVHTTSPFLYFCCASDSGVRERDEEEEEEEVVVVAAAEAVGVEDGVCVGVVLAWERLSEAAGEGEDKTYLLFTTGSLTYSPHQIGMVTRPLQTDGGMWPVVKASFSVIGVGEIIDASRFSLE